MYETKQCKTGTPQTPPPRAPGSTRPSRSGASKNVLISFKIRVGGAEKDELLRSKKMFSSAHQKKNENFRSHKNLFSVTSSRKHLNVETSKVILRIVVNIDILWWEGCPRAP